MNDEFLLVKEDVLPDVFPKVIAAREKILRDGKSVTDACKEEGISRSVYYKYKDAIYRPEETTVTKKAILSFKVEDKNGVLMAIIDKLTKAQASVLTIFQDTPIKGLAYITLKLDITNLNVELNELLMDIRRFSFVKKGELIAYD